MVFGAYERVAKSQDRDVSFSEKAYETISAEIDTLNDDLRELNLGIHGAIRYRSSFKCSHGFVFTLQITRN